MSNPPGGQVLVHRIEVPQKTRYSGQNALALVEHLAGGYKGNLTFRLSTESGKVAFELIDYQATQQRANIVMAIKSVGPAVDVETRSLTPTPYTDRIRYHLLAPLAHPSVADNNWFLSSVYLTEASEDPLTYIVNTMGEAAKSGVVTNLSFILAGANFITPEAREAARRKILHLPSDTQTIILAVIGIMAAAGGGHPTTHPAPSPDQQQKRALAKANAPNLYQLYPVLEVYGDNERLITDTYANIIDHLWNRYRGDVVGIGIHKEPVIGEIKARSVQSQAQLDRYSLPAYMKFINDNPAVRAKTCAVLTSDELAALWHLPHEGIAEEYVIFSAGDRPTPAILANTEGVTIGLHRKQPVHMCDEDRCQHVNIVGKTGTGKSTLMENLIRQDIERGKGVGVIDPHGELIKHILAADIPKDRVNDVVLIDVTNEACPPPLNPLGIRDEKGKIASGLFNDIVCRLFEDFQRAERAQIFLTGALSTLNYASEPVTIRDIVRLFQDEDYRLGILNPVDKLDDATYTFWQETYGGLTDSQRRDYPFPVIHRLNNFYSSDFLYPMLCHPKPLDWGQLMVENKIILVALDATNMNVSQKDKQLLGTLALALFETSAFRMGKPKPLDFYLYIDEAQQFINTSLDTMFSGLRKFGVHLSVSNQYLGQLRGTVLEAIMGNVGATFVFELGLDSDARELANYTEPSVSKNQLLRLGQYQAAVRMKLHGTTQSVFTMETEAPHKAISQQAADERIAYLRDLSRYNHTPMCKPDVMAWLKDHYPRRPLGGKPLKGHQEPDGNWGVPTN